MPGKVFMVFATLNPRAELPRGMTMDYSRKRLKWNGWGWHGRSFPFHRKEADFWEFVKGNLGGYELPDTPSLNWEDVFKLSKSKLHSSHSKTIGSNFTMTSAYARTNERGFPQCVGT